MAIEYLRPISNITQSGFTGGYADIDESSANDSDYAYGANNTAATLEVKLGSLSGTYVSAIVRYRIASLDNGTPRIGASDVDITCYIYEGATLRATDSTVAATGTWTTYDTWQPDLSAITDWTDVRLRFVTEAVSGWGGAISFAEIEVTGTPAPPPEGSGEAGIGLVSTGAGSSPYFGNALAPITLSAVGTGSSPDSGSGIASLVLDVVGAGSSPDSGSGEASIGLTANGIGSSPYEGSGLAPITLSAVGTGSSPNGGSGEAASMLDAIALGFIPVDGSGEALITLGAEGVGYSDISGFGIASFALGANGTSYTYRSGSGLANIGFDTLGRGFDPVEQSCEECDTCCILAKEVVGDCTKLYWQCRCPGGTLVLQKNLSGVWTDVPDFVPVDFTAWLYDTGYYFDPLGIINGTYRLKCTLFAGEVYYSNTVNAGTWNPCRCYEDGYIRDTRVWFEIEVRSFTRASFAADRVYGSPVTYSTYSDCSGEGERVELVTLGSVDVSVVYLESSKKAQVRFLNPFTLAVTYYEYEKDWNDLIRSEFCYWECFTDGISHTNTDEGEDAYPPKTGGSGHTVCFTTGGSGFDVYCAIGWVVIIREVQIENF